VRPRARRAGTYGAATSRTAPRVAGPTSTRQPRARVGSAPGLHLAKLARRSSSILGPDYSPEGVAANRATFEQFGFDPAHVIHADFFADDFVARHGGSSIWSCRTASSSTSDVRPVVARHVALAAGRPGRDQRAPARRQRRW
jgi:hypothetical protein